MVCATGFQSVILSEQQGPARLHADHRPSEDAGHFVTSVGFGWAFTSRIYTSNNLCVSSNWLKSQSGDL
jgi:hypothetical protein